MFLKEDFLKKKLIFGIFSAIMKIKNVIPT